MVCPQCNPPGTPPASYTQNCDADGNDCNPFAIVQQHILAHQYVKTGPVHTAQKQVAARLSTLYNTSGDMNVPVIDHAQRAWH